MLEWAHKVPQSWAHPTLLSSFDSAWLWSILALFRKSSRSSGISFPSSSVTRERNVEKGKAKGWRGAGKWRRWLRRIQTTQEKPQKICRRWRRHRFHHHLRCTLCPTFFFSFIYASSLLAFSLHWVCLQISKNRRVSVRTWQGKAVVDIREFYMKDGKQMPGKKGGFFTCLSIYGCIFQGHWDFQFF